MNMAIITFFADERDIHRERGAVRV